jgi:hypothetical protein
MNEWLSVIGTAKFSYKFTNALQLSRDYESGVFNKVFEEAGKDTNKKIMRIGTRLRIGKNE